jgi:LmbE family N-acetylglucosaminyl deacetylase
MHVYESGFVNMTESVAVVVAHPDDEVLGCGGTLARYAKEGCPTHVLILADGVSSRDEFSNKPNQHNAIRRGKAAAEANKILGVKTLTQLALPDNRMDKLDLLDVVKIIDDFIRSTGARTVMTHHSGDVNIDHRIVHDAVISACRPQPNFPVKELIFFEVPSSTEWRPPSSSESFNPNYYVNIAEFLDLKISALEAYAEELRDFPHPRSVKAVEALAKWRGSTVGVNAAEAFVLGRKIVI